MECKRMDLKNNLLEKPFLAITYAIMFSIHQSIEGQHGLLDSVKRISLFQPHEVVR